MAKSPFVLNIYDIKRRITVLGAIDTRFYRTVYGPSVEARVKARIDAIKQADEHFVLEYQTNPTSAKREKFVPKPEARFLYDILQCVDYNRIERQALAAQKNPTEERREAFRMFSGWNLPGPKERRSDTPYIVEVMNAIDAGKEDVYSPDMLVDH